MQYPWEKSYPTSLSWSEPLPPPVAVESFLSSAAASSPDKPALDYYDRIFSFGELERLAHRVAKGLQDLGVTSGVNVGLHLMNCPHFVAAFFGILYAGGQVVTFNPGAGRDEFVAQLEDSEIKFLLTGDWQPQYGDARKVRGRATLVICSLSDFLPEETVAGLAAAPRQAEGPGPGETRFADLVDNDGRFAPVRRGDLRDEVAVIQYTGGTTGSPKGAMLTHANFSAVMDIRTRLSSCPPPDHDFKILCVLPLWHIFGLVFIMLRAVATRTEIVLHLRFDPGKVIADAAGKRVSTFSGVPAMYAAIVAHPGFAHADLSSVVSWSSGGAPLPAEVRAEFEKRARMELREGYGLTETTSMAVETLAENQPGVGLPVPGTLVEVVDLEEGNSPMPAGEAGELCISGPQVMKGYWNRPAENAEAFRGGRFHTGDIGFVDEEGFVTLIERKKDMIIVGGHNVFPRNIEIALCAMEGVAEAAVIGVPDEDLGEVPKAFIVARPGFEPPSHGEMCRFLSGRLSTYEIPLTSEVVAALPRAATGKVLKKDLRATSVR
jgi:long-chain acyl-CoA synthetase